MTTEGTRPAQHDGKRATQPQRQPWPMWPIALSIIVFVVAYTYINIQYRKQGTSYEPYQVIMDRINASVQKNFYDWYGLTAERDVDNAAPIESPAAVTTRDEPDPLEAVVPTQVKAFLATRPILAPDPKPPECPAELAATGQPLRLKLWLPAKLGDDERFKLIATYKDGELYLIPSLFVDKIEDAADALDSKPMPFSFTLPTDPIAAKTINVHFLGERRVTEWQMTNLAPSQPESTPTPSSATSEQTTDP